MTQHDMVTIPKVELHNHLEGSIAPQLVRTLASANGIELAANLFTNDDRFRWDTFVEFLSAYDAASACLRSGDDYRQIFYQYLKSCAEEGAIYLETFVSPDHAAEVGISYEQMIEGCVQAIDDAERDDNITGRIIISCVRHLGPERALQVAQTMVAHQHPYIVGFGMGGNETMYTMADFAPAYTVIDNAGYPSTVHAGEVCGAESVRDAIEQLPVSRIGHGVRSVEDADLIAELKRRNIALEVCPGSNIALSIYPDWDSHPLNYILQSGILVSLNSDDPPFFKTSIGTEYHNGIAHFGLSVSDLYDISRMAIHASFADQSTKNRLLETLVS